MIGERLAIAMVLTVAFACSTESGSDRAETEPGIRETEEARMSEAGGPPEVSGDTITTSSGLKYISIAAGSGPPAVVGQAVRVHYSGWLTDGSKFDSSVDRGQPFSFMLGQGRVIPGWDEGVAAMRVGDRRRLIIPPELGYGARGFPGVIPANATLIFDVELLGVGE